MALQGFHLHQDKMHQYSSSFLQDLAGNSFNMANCIDFVVLSLLGLADAQRERDVLDEPANAVGVHFGFHPAEPIDSEEDLPSDAAEPSNPAD